MARELSCLLSCVGGRQRQVRLGAGREQGLRGQPGVPRTSQILGCSPGCAPGNGYSCPPCVSSPHGSPEVPSDPPAALQGSRADYHTVCRWRVKVQRGRAACPRAQPSVMRGRLHCASANVSLPDSKTYVPSFPRFKVSKIGLCLTNDAKITFRPPS